jgi:hypothetical protein
MIIGMIDKAIAQYVAPKSLLKAPLRFMMSNGMVKLFLSNSIIIGVKKLFHEATKLKIAIVAIAGFASGRMILLNILNSPQPSTRADSSRESEIVPIY